jgi:hypothetical protein
MTSPVIYAAAYLLLTAAASSGPPPPTIAAPPFERPSVAQPSDAGYHITIRWRGYRHHHRRHQV